MRIAVAVLAQHIVLFNCALRAPDVIFLEHKWKWEENTKMYEYIVFGEMGEERDGYVC